MSTKVHWMQHRGAVRDLVSDGTQLLFVTEHAEKRPTALYRLDPLKAKLEQQALPGGVALCLGGAGVYVAATDGFVYGGAFGSCAPLGKKPLEPAPIAVAPIDGGVAAISGVALVLLDGKGKELAQFELPANGTAVAADPTGAWLAAGCADGTVCVFSKESGMWGALETGKLHTGAVTTLGFEPDELRIRSTGVDNKMCLTHARGALEPEDRSGRNGHSAPVRGVSVREKVAFSASEDGTVKTWTRGSRRAPSTQKDGVGKPVASALVVVDGDAHLAVASDDDAIRLFPLHVKTEKVQSRTHLFQGAIASARNELVQSDQTRRDAALDLLAGWDDAIAIEILASLASSGSTPKFQTRATAHLGTSKHARAIPPLQKLLRSSTEGVRKSALSGLRRHLGDADLQPLQLALQAGRVDIGVIAIDALGQLAPDDSRAHAELEGALNAKDEIRTAALEALETLHPKDATASLLGFRSQHADTRWKAGLRLLQRELLDDETVQRALRSRTSDDDADVRQLAYQLLLCAYPKLAARLSYEDSDLNRKLHELRNHGAEKPGKAPKAKKPKDDPESLSVLFQAAASRSRDTSLRGAAHLAALGDSRAFGVLLQLSRDDDATIRERVCRGLQKLGDPRALDRLRAMLRDKSAEVRDAAFTAVERLLSKQPLQSAEIGLTAPHVDTRKRGLRVVTKAQKSKATDAGAALLLRALNDSDRKLRTSAFKAVIGLESDPAKGLRFTFQSLNEDVRREALTEVMGQIRQPWAWTLLLERFDDPAKALRSEAMAFARKKGKGRTPDPVATALGCKFPDLRIQALEVLAKKVDDKTAPQLVSALNDDESKVRTRALTALMRAGRLDAVTDALQSDHDDVKLTAARALAGLGRAEALPVLIAQVEAEIPDSDSVAKLTRGRIVFALLGLAMLGDAAAVVPATARLRDTDKEVRRAAAHALAQCADVDAMRSALQNDDEAVRLEVAQGLAWLGDPIGASLVFDKAQPWQKATAAVCLGEVDRVLGLIDARNDGESQMALRLLLMLAWAQPEFPTLLLAALTADRPTARLSVARVLEAWNDKGLSAAMTEVLNARVGGAHWSLEASLLRKIALAAAYGKGRARVAALNIIPKLSTRAISKKEIEEAAATVRHEWTSAVTRHPELGAIKDPGPPAKADVSGLVFGAYVGLSSEVSRKRKPWIRAAAIVRLAELGADKDATIDALIPGLSDPTGSVRAASFAALEAVGLDPGLLAEEALATGTTDMGSAGLKLLSKKGGDAVLKSVALERTDELATVAFDLLVERDKPIAPMLDAARAAVRGGAVAQLAKKYPDSKAKKALIGALKSPHFAIRVASAQALARHRDKAAFDPLVALLHTEQQATATSALVSLADSRVPAVLLDRVTDDPKGDARASDLIAAAGRYRDPEIAGRLREMANDKKWKNDAVDALVTISGYDQSIQFDVDHPDADTHWLDEQHPRHDGVFAIALTLMNDSQDERRLRKHWQNVAWARGSEVDGPLEQMLLSAKDGIRRQATTSLGWRLRFRESSSDAIKALLGHKDAHTAFLAAEALARAGSTDGMSVLLASVETLDQIAMRSRAVLALGLLADDRALDTLLRIVSDEEHALIEAAAEAIGHLSKSDAADDILARLKQLAAGTNNVARRALVGLRWFDSPAAWTVIHGRIDDEAYNIRVAAIELLGFDDRPEARDALTRVLLAADYQGIAETAGEALRRLEGPDSLEPDYTFVRSRFGSPEPDTLQRLREGGDPARILDAMSDPSCAMVDPLILALCARDPLPIDEAVSLLADQRVRAPGLSARILGRAAKLKKPAAKSLATALGTSLTDWSDRRSRGDSLGERTLQVGWLVWACAKHGVAGEHIASALRLPGPEAAPLRKAANTSLSLTGDVALLEEALGSDDASIRATAAGALVVADAKRAAKAVSLDDLGSADRVLRGGASPPGLADAAGQVHTQGIVLTHLVARGELAAIGAALKSPEENVLLGAIEALGALGDEKAEAQLAGFASDDARDEELRKAAWRAIRRSKRTRARKEAR